MTSTLGRSQPRSTDLLPPTLQTIPEAIGKNIAVARVCGRAHCAGPDVVESVRCRCRGRGGERPPMSAGNRQSLAAVAGPG